MKRCPECRKDYFDDSLQYCLDDGAQLVQGSVTDEPATAIMPSKTTSDSVTAGVGLRSKLPWIIAGVLLLSLLAALPFAISYYRNPSAGSEVVRFPVTLPEGVTFEWDVEAHNLAISPDGTRVVFVARSEGQQKLWLRSLREVSIVALPGSEGAISPFWDPHSRFVAFFADGKLKKIEVPGGSPQTVCDLNSEVEAVGTWGRNGTIVFATDFSTRGGIYRVPETGGVPELLRESTVESVSYWVHFLPDGRHFLFSTASVPSANGVTTPNGIQVGSIDSAEAKLLIQTNGPARAQYAAPGYLLYPRDGALVARAFDPRTQSLSGEPFPVVERFRYFDKTGWAEFSASESGVLVHLNNIFTSQFVWFDRDGREGSAIVKPAEQFGARLSPDDKKVSFAVADQTGSADLWILDLGRETSQTRFTVGAADEGDPVWSPDGRRLAFFSCCEAGKSTLRIKDLSDTTSTGRSPFEAGFNAPWDWSSDGRFILYSKNQPTVPRDIWALPLSGEQKPYPFLQTQFNEWGARFSPDGRWVAFMSNESGRQEIYVMSFENPGEKWSISNGGGRSPRWRRNDGKELFFLSADRKLMSVSVKSGAATFEAGAPTPLFKLDSIIEDDYDVTADGQRFLVNSGVAGARSLPFTVVLNWTAELKR